MKAAPARRWDVFEGKTKPEEIIYLLHPRPAEREVVFCHSDRAYLCHVIQAVEDVLASLLGLDPRFTLVVLWSLWETKSRCSSQIPSHFPSGNTLFTFGLLQPLVVDVQQDSACPPSNPGVTHKR